MLLADLPPLFVRIFLTFFGLLWGSFLNVVIYRVPRGMSVVTPPSACPACGKPIAPYDNIPVLTYLLLRGRARCCGVRMSPRYPVVEAIGGVVSLACVMHAESRLGPSVSLLRFGLYYGTEFALVLGLVAAAFIDIEFMILPDAITLSGTLLGVVSAPLRGESPLHAGGYAVAGFLAIYVPFIVVYRQLRGVAGMGMGDAKLLALAAAWLGPLGALFTLLFGAVQGTVYALFVYLVRGKIDEPAAVIEERNELERLALEGDEEAREILEDDPLGKAPEGGLSRARIPFGPFLILGCLEFLFYGDRIRDAFDAYLMF